MSSLRSKIYTGFAVVASLLVAIGLIGYFGATHLHNSAYAMRRISDLNAVVLRIDCNVQELQLRVSRYMTSGDDSLRDDIIKLNTELVTLIRHTTNEQTDVEMRDLFERMSEHLPEYKKHFDTVIRERGIRADLVQTQLPEQSAVILKKFRELSSLIAQKDFIGADHVDVLRCESFFSQAEKKFLRYYVSPNTAFVNEAQQNLLAAIAALREQRANDETATLEKELVAEIEEYERIGLRAVQATRSYLFLVNVVMAGEASEVSYYSDRLRKLSDPRRDQISAEVAATTAGVRRITSVGIGVALALALFIAARLAMSILQPIAGLTATFQRLADGETVVTVPDIQRTDEIGQMAKAAGVFSEQNRKRQELLEQSELLTQQLAKKAAELETTNADLDSFAYVASHDLKSPLRGIRQLSTWIDEDSGHLLPEGSVKHLRAMQRRVARMELLLDDLLHFSRIGRSEAAPELVDLESVLKGVIEITDNPEGVTIACPKSVPPFFANRVSLEQVLLNLIGNAIKHNDKGSDGRVEIQCENHKTYYRFSIADNGPGIETQHHERVFQMYQRVGNNNVDGSGMGLAIVKKHVERLGGQICLASNRGNGVTFHFTWPVSTA